MRQGVLTLWTIMDRPDDFPDRIIVVLDEIGPTGAFRRPERWFADSIEQARTLIHRNDPTADVCQPRSPEDPKCIVETWF